MSSAPTACLVTDHLDITTLLPFFAVLSLILPLILSLVNSYRLSLPPPTATSQNLSAHNVNSSSNNNPPDTQCTRDLQTRHRGGRGGSGLRGVKRHRTHEDEAPQPTAQSTSSLDAGCISPRSYMASPIFLLLIFHQHRKQFTRPIRQRYRNPLLRTPHVCTNTTLVYHRITTLSQIIACSQQHWKMERGLTTCVRVTHTRTSAPGLKAEHYN
jgi:hypothetical protein